jgi:hypothetical protein
MIYLNVIKFLVKAFKDLENENFEYYLYKI